jgi:hypothetical protein
MLVDRTGLEVPGVATGGLVSFPLARASASFLLAAVSMVTNVERAKFDTVSCWRTVVLLAAARARLFEGCPKPVNGCGRGRDNSVGATQQTPHPRC